MSETADDGTASPKPRKPCKCAVLYDQDLERQDGGAVYRHKCGGFVRLNAGTFVEAPE